MIAFQTKVQWTVCGTFLSIIYFSATNLIIYNNMYLNRLPDQKDNMCFGQIKYHNLLLSASKHYQISFLWIFEGADIGFVSLELGCPTSLLIKLNKLFRNIYSFQLTGLITDSGWICNFFLCFLFFNGRTSRNKWIVYRQSTNI